LSVLKSIEDLFKKLGLEVEVPNIEDFLDEQQYNMTELVDAELKDWRLEASDVEDADIEVTRVDRVDIGEIASFGTKAGGNNIIAVGTAMVEANVSYIHPDWDSAIYDSEDDTLTPWNDDVSGETTVELDLEFSMSIQVNEKGEPTEIKQISITDDMDLFVTLHPSDEYK
jgi:hypothetical protein